MNEQLKINDLVKNTGIIAIGKMSTQIVSFLLLPVYTAYLTTEDYGIVDLISVLVQVLLPIITLQLEQAVFRFLIEVRDNEREIKRIISTTIVFLTFQTIIYTIFIAIFGCYIHNEYKYYLFFNLITCMYSYIFTQIARGLGRNGIYSLANFLMSFLNIILNIWFIVGIKSGASGMILASCISNLFCMFFVLISTKIYKYISIKKVNKKIYIKMLRYAVPLIPNQISWWVFSSSDRLIITAMLSVSANGIYAISCKFSTLFTTIYNFYNLSWTEQAVLHFKDNNIESYLRKNIDLAFRFFSSIILGIIVIMPLIFHYLINEQYADSYKQIPILLVGAWFNMIVGLFSVIYIAKGLTKSIARTSIISAIINILVNIVFVKSLGLYAASLSTVVAYAFLAFYRIYDIRKIIAIKLDYKLFINFAAAFLITILGYYINILPVNIFNLLFAIIFALVFNKKIIQYIILMIKR